MLFRACSATIDMPKGMPRLSSSSSWVRARFTAASLISAPRTALHRAATRLMLAFPDKRRTDDLIHPIARERAAALSPRREIARSLAFAIGCRSRLPLAIGDLARLHAIVDEGQGFVRRQIKVGESFRRLF